MNNGEETRVLLALFSSRTRLKILQLFFSEEGRSFFVREITRKINERINSVRRELENLTDIGLLSTFTDKNKTYYLVSQKFFFYEELKSIFVKITPEKTTHNYILRLANLNGIEKIFASGIFTENKKSPTDILIVGNVGAKKIKDVIVDIEKDIGSMVRYTILAVNDFLFRESVNDKFLRDILFLSECVYSKSS